MARLAIRLQVVESSVLLALGRLVARAAEVQLVQGRRWAEEAQAQRTERIVLAPRRGTLWDRHGTPLALTQETYHVGIAPNELRDSVADGALIRRRLGLPARTWLQALRKRYAYFAGPYSALEPQPRRAAGGIERLAPATGARLALASRRRDGAPQPSAVTHACGPGSIAKIFGAAARRGLGRVAPRDHVPGEGGTYRLPGRTTADEQPL